MKLDIGQDQRNEANQYLAGRGFVKTEGFEKAVVFLMALMTHIREASEMYKSFRLEFDYDAEALNTRYRFYVPGPIDESDRTGQESSAG